jgi:glucosamine--fructose-6-phosphate aminotransferase (isomerizing)
MSLVERELREAPDAVARQETVLAAPLEELTARLARHQPTIVVTCARGSSAHAATFALCLIQSFYAMAPRLAAARGVDPDKPRHLQKVTRTR